MYIPKDFDLVWFVWNVRYIKTFIRLSATPLIKEVCFWCLNPDETGWIADRGSSVMDCVYTVFPEQEVVFPGPGQPQWHIAMRN